MHRSGTNCNQDTSRTARRPIKHYQGERFAGGNQDSGERSEQIVLDIIHSDGPISRRKLKLICGLDDIELTKTTNCLINKKKIRFNLVNEEKYFHFGYFKPKEVTDTVDKLKTLKRSGKLNVFSLLNV